MKNEILYSLDKRRRIALPGTAEETVEFAVEHFISTAQNAIESHGSFFVALSGGSTPKKIFQKLASPPYREAFDWKQVYLFWSDERAVSPDDPESNYKMAMESGFKTLPIPSDHIFRMQGEGDMEKHANEYEKKIRNELRGRPFDLIMLGMGEDGHTASLFPGTKALSISDKWVVANDVPQKNTRRMTFTFPLINSAKATVFYVIGEDKQKVACEVLLNPSSNLPAAQVGTPTNPALWILDDKAAKLLQNTLKAI